MRLLVIGGGPAGRRHVRNAVDLGLEVGLVRRPGSAGERPAGVPEVPVLAGLDEAAGWEAEGVVVATPPSEHLESARWALSRGCHVLVEKPLAASAAGVAELLDDARAAGLRLAVAYNLRFHPGLRAVETAVRAGRIGRLLAGRVEVGSFLPSWHPEDDYRRGSAADRELGGGALLTLAHELDLALWIAGPAELVAGAAARVTDLVDADDVAELVLRHEGGALTSVHMDLLDRAYNRRSRWVGETGTIEWAWGGAVSLADGGGGGETLWDEPGFDLEETYRDELDAFVRGESAPGDALADARRALELIDGVRRL